MQRVMRHLILFFCAVAAVFVVSPVVADAAALSEKELRANLQQEQSKAKLRRESLKRLTTQERNLDSNLAEAEARILKLEQSLAEQQKKLSGLVEEGDVIEKEYNQLMQERRKTENSMRQLLGTFWDIYSQRESVGGRDLQDWPIIDRNYYWTAELFKALDGYRDQLEAQEKKLNVVVSKRNALGQEINGKMAQIEKEKERLLVDRVRYEQRLAATRKQKEDVQADLDATLKLIDDLNFDLKAAQVATGDIEKAKSKLTWPVKGTVELKFQPNATPPVQGIGIATNDILVVRAVHPGKVMFNDTMRGLGRVVVVQHGPAYFTVYAFLSESSVGLGNSVNAQQQIGKTGYYPAIKKNGLYFELRYHQKAVNPELWLSKAGN